MIKAIDNNKAQSTLELAVAIVCVFMLLYGTLNTFIWLNKRLIWRHEEYEKTRVKAGSEVNPVPILVDDANYAPLRILGE